MPDQITINPALLQELDTAITQGSLDIQDVITSLTQYKATLAAQGFAESSLAPVYDYCDALIQMMTLLADNLTLLGDNASEIADSFSTLDRHLAMTAYPHS